MRNALLIASLICWAVACSDNAELDGWQLTDSVDLPEAADTTQLQECDEFPERYEFEPGGGDTVRNDIVIDAGGCPHVSFYQDGQLKYARWNGEFWRLETIAVDAPNWTHALAVDETGRAHIAFDTIGHPQVKLATRTPDGWVVEDVSPEFAWDIQFEFESGEPLLMVLATPEQYSGAGGELLALTRSNTGWRRQEIALGADARTLDSPIAIGREGAAISITTDEWNTGSNIRWVERVRDEWSVSRVTSEQDLDSLRTLTAPGSTPHVIACTSKPNEVDTVEHARLIDGVWNTQTLDHCGQQSACWCAGAATDDDDRVHILYLRPDDDLGSSFDRLIYATFEGTWQRRALGIYHRSGDSSLALDPRSGAPHVLATTRDENGDRKTVYLPPSEVQMPSPL